jgi:hypothetical protein
MAVHGKVRKGKVVLDNPNALAEGTEVEVRPIRKKPPKKPPKTKAKIRPQSLAERLAPFIGVVKDLPPDMSVNLDHNLYGHAEQK